MDNDCEYLLQVENLWKVFTDKDQELDIEDAVSMENAEADGAVTAIRGVSFHIKQGEVFVIMGLSGSGKSTLIRCLPRLIEPTSGTIIAGGEDVTSMNKKELTQFRRTRTAMVFQHYGLLPHRTVLENVSFGLKLRGIERKRREKRAFAAIEKVGLKSWENYYPAQLSGGMQQRVGIARALVQEADILLMDEPFSGLDPLIRREMQEELIRLQAELKKTIIFVTHDLSEAVQLGDRMAVMKSGVFVQQGVPKDIIMNPADEYVQRFVQDEQKMAIMSETTKGSNIHSFPAAGAARKELPAAAGRR